MHLATIAVGGSPSAAVLVKDDVWLEISPAARNVTGEIGEALKTGATQAIIDAGPEAIDAIRALIRAAEAGDHADACHAADAVSLLAPIPVPRKNVFCVGRNYREHIEEGERAQNKKIGVTEHPVYFTKPCTAVIGPNAHIPIFQDLSEAMDYEVELTVVIGKAGRNISKEDAYDHVFGYTILNDISARDVQRRHGGQYFKGKALDGSCPLGPWIVTADAISDPHALAISSSVNGELRQNSTTASMIFDIPTLISSLSEGLTLQPGDLIGTGTPSGVGYAMDPPQFLKDGDHVVCEIAEIGQLENTMRNDDDRR